MKQVLQNFRSGQLRVENVPVPACKPGQVLVRNLYSVVSAGTEKHSVEFAQKNILQKAGSRPDLVRKVLNSVRTDGLGTAYSLALSRLDDWKPLGYSTSGRILQVGSGVTDLAVGDLVACGGAGYANHAEVIAVPRNLVARIPEGADALQASFATLAAIALEGIHRANLTPGESVGIIGLGLLGQLTALLLMRYGTPVLGIDVSPKQVEKALVLGVRAVTSDQAVAAIKGIGEGRGLDAVIITAATPSSEPVRLAGELCRERGRVSAVGLVGMDIPRQLYYDKELDFNVSRSYGPGRYDPGYEERGKDYPLGYVRWTENRNLQEFLRLLAAGLDLSPLITHIFPISEAESVYQMILAEPPPEYFLGVLFEYDANAPLETRVALRAGAFSSRPSADVRLGVIGPGSFARASLLPPLRKMPGVSIVGVSSATGRTAQPEARASGAAYCTSDDSEILNDPQINTVLVATRHDQHARLVVQALDAGKHVFVEKPLALSVPELCEVMAALERHPDQVLVVGYNRRFSRYTRKLQAALSNLPHPFVMHYRVNAGFIDAKSWVHDPVEGGGRIVGEVCHFVDLLQAIAGSAPAEVYARAVGGSSDAARLQDNLAITLTFEDGSVGNIIYTALGPRSLAKERLEVFAGGKAFLLDNYKALFEYGESSGRHGGRGQDKGHARLVEEFVRTIQKGGHPPIPRRELLLSSLSTFAILDSLHTGAPAPVALDSLG